MTLTAVKLVRVQIFASIGKAIAKKNADGRTDERTDGRTAVISTGVRKTQRWADFQSGRERKTPRWAARPPRPRFYSAAAVTSTGVRKTQPWALGNDF